MIEHIALGPWTFEPVPSDAHTDPDIQMPDDCTFWIAEARHAGEVVALLQETSRHTAEASARLMVAAPELLAACRWARDVIDPMTGQEASDLSAALAAAIQKAEGQ